MAIKVTGTTVINDSRNIENITTINGTTWATVVAGATGTSEINDLTDVTIATAANGQVLKYNGTSGVWENTGLNFSDISSTLADAQVAESNVTQHQAALSITESQISDLQSYSLDSHNHTLDSLSNTTITSASAGEFLKWNGSAWVNDSVPQINAVGDIADVTITSNSAGELLVWSGSAWVNNTLAEAGIEAADSTILKDADIGVTVQAFDSTILKDADIGVTVQAYDANIVSDANYVATDENFTTADHAKLDGIEANAKDDQSAAEVPYSNTTSSLTATNVQAAVDEVEGRLDTAETKLSGIEANADVTDATNVQAAGALMDSEVTNLAQVKAFDSADYATAGHNHTLDGLSNTTITSNTSGEILKWNGTAWVNNTLAEAGIQAAGSYEPADSTILKDADIGVTVQAYDANIVSDATYVATDNNFTTALKNKLDGIESGATGDQTAAEIRTLVGSATDSNVFTDADHSKLDGIEANATADQTAGEIEAIVNHDNLQGFVANEHIDWTAASAGTIHATNIPAVALTTVQTAANQTAHLALTAQEGDVVVRSDENKTYIHNGGTAGTMADYTLLATPTDAVLSVDGQTGAVTLNHDSLTGFVANEHIDWTAASAGTIHASNYTNTTYNNATTSVAGLMSASDKTKMDGIEAGATGDQTAAEIRTLVGSATDSNVFTDADHSKLDGIEASADVTDATNVAAAGAAMTSGATFTGAVGVDADFDVAGTKFTVSSSTGNGSFAGNLGVTGQLNVTGAINPSSTVDGRDIAADGTKLDGISSGATANPNAIDNLVEDTTPQLGGTLDTNGNLIQFGDSSGATDDRLKFGASQDLEIYHSGSDSYIVDNGTGSLRLRGSAVYLQNATGTETGLIYTATGSVRFYHGNDLRMAGSADGITTYKFLRHQGTATAGIEGYDGEITYRNYTAKESITVATATPIMTIPHTGGTPNFRSIEATIQIKNTSSGAREIQKVMVTTDGSSAYITNYGEVSTTGASLADFTVDLNGNDLRILTTQGTTTQHDYKIYANMFTD